MEANLPDLPNLPVMPETRKPARSRRRPHGLHRKKKPHPSPPPGYSLPEWLVQLELVALGLEPELDFTTQNPFGGGRQELGGAVIDFTVYSHNVGIGVWGVYFHAEHQGGTVEADILRRISFESVYGWRFIFIEDEHVLDNAEFYVREALEGRDHSRLGVD